MRRITALLLLGAVALAGIATAGKAPEKPKIKALFITGCDVGAHPWRQTTPALRKILEDTGKFEVVVCEDPAILESKTALAKYDVILQNYFNAGNVPPISDVAKENLAAFIRGGKGFVTFHLSSASWKEWDEWKKICGRNWIMRTSGHGPYGKFESKVVKDHPITKGVPKTFETEDELYAKLQGDTPINVLVEAYSDWSKKIEPLAFTVEYGKGRVYHHCYGHRVVSIQTPAVAKLWAQGCEWAATGDVK
jgi:type 1 glutamine amidotransferase